MRWIVRHTTNRAIRRRKARSHVARAIGVRDVGTFLRNIHRPSLPVLRKMRLVGATLSMLRAARTERRQAAAMKIQTRWERAVEVFFWQVVVRTRLAYFWLRWSLTFWPRVGLAVAIHYTREAWKRILRALRKDPRS